MINYQIVLIVLASLLVGGLGVKFLPTIIKKIKEINILIRTYWIFSVILFLLNLLTNSLIYFKKITITYELVNFYTGFIFAIYTGYTAFKQFQDSRYGKIKKEARNMFRSGEEEFEKARRRFDEAYKINPNDEELLSEYAELTMILENWDLLGKLICRLEKVKIGKEVDLIIFYLKIGEQLIKQHIGDAKNQVKVALEFIEKNSLSFKSFSWSFDELKETQVYKKLGSGDSKKIFDALIQYLIKKNDESRETLKSLI